MTRALILARKNTNCLITRSKVSKIMTMMIVINLLYCLFLSKFRDLSLIFRLINQNLRLLIFINCKRLESKRILRTFKASNVNKVMRCFCKIKHLILNLIFRRELCVINVNNKQLQRSPTTIVICASKTNANIIVNHRFFNLTKLILQTRPFSKKSLDLHQVNIRK